MLRVGGEDGPWEGDDDGWRVYNHPGVTAGHDTGLIAAGGQGLGTLCLAGVGACQLVGSHHLAVVGECLQFICRIRKKPKPTTMHLVTDTSKLGSKRSLDRDNLDKDNSRAPFLVSATFYLACMYLSFLICCFKLALFASFPLGEKNPPLSLCAASKTDIYSKSSQSLVIFPGDKFELVPTASLFLPHAASQGSDYSLNFTDGVQGSEGEKKKSGFSIDSSVE